jgi:hypothetical protein
MRPSFGPAGSVLADAQVEMPAAEVDRGVPVVHRDAFRRVRRRNLPHRALDDDAEPDFVPVFVEVQVDQVEQTLLVGGQRPKLFPPSVFGLDHGGAGISHAPPPLRPVDRVENEVTACVGRIHRLCSTIVEL